MAYPKEVRLPTDKGDAVATKDAQGEPWHIAMPTGDSFFYGPAPAAVREMRRLAKIAELEVPPPVRK